YARGNQLARGKYIEVVDPRLCTIEEVRPVDRNVDVIQTGRDQQLVDFRGTDGPHIVERIGLIGPVEELRCTVRVAVKRLIFQICEVHAAKLQPLFIGQV